MKKIFFRSILFFLIMIAYSFPQKMDGVKVTDAGTFEGKINGKEFSNPIRYGESEDLLTIATGNQNFTLTINWKGVSSLKEIKSGSVTIPDKNNSVTVIYLDNNAGMPSIVTSGTITIKNDEKEFSGTLVFTASTGGIPKEMGGTETKLSDGKFLINVNK